MSSEHTIMQCITPHFLVYFAPFQQCILIQVREDGHTCMQNIMLSGSYAMVFKPPTNWRRTNVSVEGLSFLSSRAVMHLSLGFERS